MSRASSTERRSPAFLASRTLRRFLELASLGSGLLALFIVLTGGATVQWGAFRMRAHDATLPFILAVCGGAVSVFVGGRQAVSSDARAPRHLLARRGAVALSVGTLLAGIGMGTFTAGGADSSGYLNEAELIAAGRLTVDLPLARTSPASHAVWLMTPLGFRPGVAPATMVPTYAPGFPLTLAAVRMLAGRWASFLVVPIMGAAGVWLTFWLGRRVGGAGAGLMAATLLACSPIFLFQLAQPMSDVPTTVWWLAAMVLATDPTPRSSVGAGSIVSLALLTRPNLMPLAVVVGAYLWWNKWSDRRASSVPEPGRLLTWFASAAAVGVIVIAAWHAHLYGSPVRSGYGAASELFSLSFARPNIQRYTVWMFQTHTPLVALAVLAPFAARLTPSGDGLARQPDVDGNLVERFSWCALGFSGAVFVAYLIYASFDDWTFLRFLLPAFPLVFVLVGLTIGRLAQWLAAPSRTPVLFAVTAVIAVVYLSIASDRGVFRFREHERRYRAVGEFLAARLPADAMIVTVQHSGSAFYYSGRPILRWDAIEGGQLEETLAWVRQHGYRPFVVLERWEVQPFRERFASASPLGGLDWPPMAQHRAGVLVYDPEQRSRFTTGAIVTEDIDNLSDGVWSRLWP